MKTATWQNPPGRSDEAWAAAAWGKLATLRGAARDTVRGTVHDDKLSWLGWCLALPDYQTDSRGRCHWNMQCHSGHAMAQFELSPHHNDIVWPQMLLREKNELFQEFGKCACFGKGFGGLPVVEVGRDCWQAIYWRDALSMPSIFTLHACIIRPTTKANHQEKLGPSQGHTIIYEYFGFHTLCSIASKSHKCSQTSDASAGGGIPVFNRWTVSAKCNKRKYMVAMYATWPLQDLLALKGAPKVTCFVSVSSENYNHGFRRFHSDWVGYSPFSRHRVSFSA